MSFRDNGDKEKVQAATDIVRLVGEQVNLKPKGREFAGLCPFHDDHSPSMQVSPQKQIYKCFSCGAGGDVFSFVMNYHKMEFVESLKYLAERAGVELTPWKPDGQGPGAGDQGSGKTGARKRIAAANEQAVGFFRAMLKHAEHGREARAYLERRGVSAAMVETFQLGYAPDKWDGLGQMIRHKQWDPGDFLAAGLLKPKDKASDPNPEPRVPTPAYDALRHRLVFPIFDAIGRPIAFGGRKLREEDEPKYLNSPETALFNKSATLYGLHAAKKPIIDAKTAVIVEGYTDVIACHQAGASNVVAALGTALTPEHVRELRRYCDQVVLVMDGDAAGQKAADRAVQVFLTGDLDVSIAVLPEGRDPDELLKAGGLDAWREVIASAEDALVFAFRRAGAELGRAETVTGRQKVAEGFMDQLISLGLTDAGGPGGVRQAFVVARLAEMLGMSEAGVQSAIRQRDTRDRRPAERSVPAPDQADKGAAAGGGEENEGADGVAQPRSRHRLTAAGRAERRLMAALVRYPDLFTSTLADGSSLDEAISPAELAHTSHRRLYQRIYDALAAGREVTLSGLSGDLSMEDDSEQRDLLLAADHELDQALPAAPEPDPDAGADELAELPVVDRHAEVRALLVDAAEAVVRFRREMRYEATRRAVMQSAGPGEGPEGHPPAASDDRTPEHAPATLAATRQQQLLELVEHRRSNPSPRRIPRPRTA